MHGGNTNRNFTLDSSRELHRIREGSDAAKRWMMQQSGEGLMITALRLFNITRR